MSLEPHVIAHDDKVHSQLYGILGSFDILLRL
jgi:hypothetical protein